MEINSGPVLAAGRRPGSGVWKNGVCSTVSGRNRTSPLNNIKILIQIIFFNPTGKVFLRNWIIIFDL
jgi:hypothetical protein